MASTSGGELVARMLAAEGVEVVFGIIDGTYFGLYSSLGRHGIRLVSPRHESTAAHMAGAYARLTGRLGVCLASNGPGAANVLRVGDTIVAHPGFPRTLDRVAALGVDVRPLDVSEFLKAEAALTCKSLLFRR